MKTLEAWKTITLFISSTFSDMEAERDCIKKHVIPELEDFFAPYHVAIRTVDLRWGIKTNDQKDTDRREAKILKVCLDEIDRSRPFFIGLLGERYGWVPSEKRLQQLIPHLNVNDFRTLMDIQDPSVTALEMFYGVLHKKDNLHRSLFCLRSGDSYSSLPDEMRKDYFETEKEEELNSLKEYIYSTYGTAGLKENIIDYHPQWEEYRFAGLEDFRKQLVEKLKKEILEEIQLEDTVFASNWIEQEIIDQQDFIDRSTAHFIGRDEILAHIESELTEKKKRILLTGESGTGKSALMAKSYLNLQERFSGENKEDAIFLFHSAGITGMSGRIANMIESFCRQIASALQEEYQPVEYDAEMSSDEFKDFSSWVSTFKVIDEREFISRNDIIVSRFTDFVRRAQEREKQLYIFIDAFDRFAYDKGLSNLFWLPGNISLIISSLPQQGEHLLELPIGIKEVTIPDFDKKDAHRMISSLCRRHAKELHESVSTKLLAHLKKEGTPSHSSPLWMTLATGALFTLDMDDFRAIRMRSEADNEQKIENYMLEIVSQFPPGPGELFLFLVDKAANDFGEEITYGALRYLAASRKGLREEDLAGLLGEHWSELSFASLRRWFRPFFAESGMGKQWTITHQLLKEKLNEKFTGHREETHRQIYTRLINLESDDPLRVSELLYHTIYAGEKLLHTYTYSCRLPVAIREATYTLVAELESNPSLVKQLVHEIEKQRETGKSMQKEFSRLLEMLDQTMDQKGMGVSDDTKRYQKQISANRHTLDRVIRSLCSHLMRVGRNEIALPLLKAIEPIAEEETNDMVIHEILKPLLYQHLIKIYGQAYDEENKQIYTIKNRELERELSGKEDPIGLKYYTAVNELSENYTELNLQSKYQQVYTIIDTYDTDQWDNDWLDQRAQDILMGIFSTLSLLTDIEEEEANEYKDFLSQLYSQTVEMKEKGWLDENYKAEKLKTYSYSTYRAKALALLLEGASNDFAIIHEGLAEAIAKESTEIYRQLYILKPDAGSMFDLSTSFQAKSRLFGKMGRTKESLDALLLARQVAEDMLKQYPELEDSKLRVMAISRMLGEFLFERKGYQDAIHLFREYKKWASHLYDKNTGRTQWLSSLVTACHWVARTLEELDQVEEADQEYDLCCNMSQTLFGKTKSIPFLRKMAEIHTDYSYFCMKQEN